MIWQELVDLVLNAYVIIQHTDDLKGGSLYMLPMSIALKGHFCWPQDPCRRMAD